MVYFDVPVRSCPLSENAVVTALVSNACASFSNPTKLGLVTPGNARRVTIPAGTAVGVAIASGW